MIYDQCMQQQLLTFIMTVVGEGDGVDECVRVGVCVCIGLQGVCGVDEGWIDRRLGSLVCRFQQIALWWAGAINQKEEPRLRSWSSFSRSHLRLEQLLCHQNLGLVGQLKCTIYKSYQPAESHLPKHICNQHSVSWALCIASTLQAKSIQRLILYTIKGLMCKTSDKWSAPKTRRKSKTAVQCKVTQINSWIYVCWYLYFDLSPVCVLSKWNLTDLWRIMSDKNWRTAETRN